MHFLCYEHMCHCKQFTAATGSLHLMWHKVVSRCHSKRQILRKWHSELAHLAYTNLHICYAVWPFMKELFNRIETVFKSLKIRPKRCHFFSVALCFWNMVYQQTAFLLTQIKSIVKKWLVPTSQKEVHSFLWLALYYWCFIPNFTGIAKSLH